jgi:hypothetical protein
MDRPIYLTTKRLLYNVARIDFRNGRIEQSELNRVKKEWEREYNDLELQEVIKKKFNKGNDKQN